MGKLGLRIKDLRLAQGLGVREFAAKLQKSPGYISRVEGRGEIPSPEFLCQASNVLEVPPEELLELAKADVLERTREVIGRRHTEALSLFRRKNK